MNVKVIVDKLPEGCTNCDFDDFMADNALGECMILGKEFEPGNSFLCPDWCPLVTKQQYDDELFAELNKSIGITQHEYDLRKANPYDLNDVAKLTRKEE